MSGVVVEFANWPASDAYKEDPTVINPALEFIAATKGAQKIWHGLQIEDQSTAFLVIIWDALADHQALIDDKVAYPKLVALLTPSLGGALTLFHVAFTSNPAPVDELNAPVSEIVVQTVKEGKAAELEALFEKVGDGGKNFATGKIVEKEDQYVLLKGWPSVEAHREAAQSNEHVKGFMAALAQLIVPSVRHVKLTAYTA